MLFTDAFFSVILNGFMFLLQSYRGKKTLMGLLDIYGFEIFEANR